MPLPPPPDYLDKQGPTMEPDGPRVPALSLQARTGGDIAILCDVALPGFELRERRGKDPVWESAGFLAIPLQARRRWTWAEGREWCPHRERAPDGARSQAQCLVMLVAGAERPLAVLTGHGGRGVLMWGKLVELATELRKQVGQPVPLSSVALSMWGSEAESPLKRGEIIPAWDWSVKAWALEGDVTRARDQRAMVDSWRAAWDRR